MSKPVNKSLIGVFVIGSLALAVAAVLILGSGKFFTPMKKFVMYFEGSVKGLNVGAPVIFRGVTIGEVKDVHLHFDPQDLTAFIPVYIEIDPRKIKVPAAFIQLRKETEKKYLYIQPLIAKGLKAQLQTQSFVTGQLMINLDLLPDKPIKLVGLDKKYPEIPTVPSSMEELTKTLQDLKLEELSKKITLAVEGIEKIVNSPEIAQSLKSLNQNLKDINKLVNNLDAQVNPLMTNLQGTSEQIKETFISADKSFQQAEKTLASIQVIAEGNADVGYELNRTLKEVSTAARSLRFLADSLERHPEALLRGKPAAQGE